VPNSPAPARAALVAAYLLLAGAGLVALIWASPSVAQAGRIWAFTWAGFLVVGGLTSAYGAARRSWFGEYAGLPLLIAVWAVYGISAGWAAVAASRPETWAACCALLAVAALLAYRWEVIAVYRRASRETATNRRDP
jgi:hypothetical protein